MFNPRSDCQKEPILDDLFSPRLRQFLGERWDQYVLHAVQVFYHKTVRVANDPSFRDLLDSLCRRHGEEFIRKWNEAQSDDGSQDTLPPVDVGGTIVPHDSPYGMIEYLVMQTIFRFPYEYELIMYVPLGTENQQRYQKFKGTMNGNTIYFSR